jgi:TRAP-type C4-dicarboxylate transport system permease small subunit
MTTEVDPRSAGPAAGALGRGLERACKVAAIAGSLVFVGLVLMSIVSITGRKLVSTPVPGDVEMLQLCAAFASSSFFAWCHLNRGDVKVDFFTEHLAARYVHALDAFGSLLVGGFGALIAWRTAAGAAALQATGETTMILGVPVWVGQALMVPGFLLLALAGAYRAVGHWQGMRHGTAASAVDGTAARQP